MTEHWRPSSYFKAALLLGGATHIRPLVPKAPTDAIPRGAAILGHGRGSALVLANARERFGERCAQAARHGQLIRPPGGCVEVGHYESTDGEVRLRHGGALTLSRWLGHPVSRSDLEARDNRTDRRHPSDDCSTRAVLPRPPESTPVWGCREADACCI